jgi:TolA-binding protein
VAAVALTGCVSRVDFNNQDHDLRELARDNRRQIEAVQHEVERLRAEIEEGGPHHKGTGTFDDRLNAVEQQLQGMQGGKPAESSPSSGEGTSPEAGATAAVPTTPTPTTTVPPKPSADVAEDDEWKREVGREQAAVGAMNVADRGEYLALLDPVLRKDCGRAIPQLNGFAAGKKESPLADNALYWAARCYALKGESNQAISKFYDVVTRYPKGDKAAPALWAQGNLFIDIGDTPDARLAFAKLIRDYPGSDEAGRARQKLPTLEH